MIVARAICNHAVRFHFLTAVYIIYCTFARQLKLSMKISVHERTLFLCVLVAGGIKVVHWNIIWPYVV